MYRSNLERCVYVTLKRSYAEVVCAKRRKDSLAANCITKTPTTPRTDFASIEEAIPKFGRGTFAEYTLQARYCSMITPSKCMN